MCIFFFKSTPFLLSITLAHEPITTTRGVTGKKYISNDGKQRSNFWVTDNKFSTLKNAFYGIDFSVANRIFSFSFVKFACHRENETDTKSLHSFRIRKGNVEINERRNDEKRESFARNQLVAGGRTLPISTCGCRNRKSRNETQTKMKLLRERKRPIQFM